MSLNRQSGNMYNFVTHTWNVIKGKCPYDCNYCYMKKFKLNNPRFDEKELKTDLGRGNFIFVGSSIDMFAESFSNNWIYKILEHCRKYDNKYLFQSKNPERFFDFGASFPINTILGTTIESNRDLGISKAPSPRFRMIGLMNSIAKKMCTIEPIMDFDVYILVAWMKAIKLDWINIGADSKGHDLREPAPEKIKELIEELKKFTVVKTKDNLKRLYKEQY